MTMGTTELCQWLRQNSAGIYRPAAEAADEIEALVVARDAHFRQAMKNGAAALEARDERDALRKAVADVLTFRVAEPCRGDLIDNRASREALATLAAIMVASN